MQWDTATTNLVAAELGAPWAFAPVARAAAPAPMPDPAASAAPAQQGQGVFAVFPEYQTELYAGYTYFRFYEIPHFSENMNGLNLSLAYYLRDWVAVDGELVATFGSQAGVSSKFVMGMGGARLRWMGPRGLALWAHGMAGGSHFLPQTAFGGQDAFGFEAGGGVDLIPPHKRLGFRLQVDMVGTHYFGTYQYSPKVSAGVVYKF
ncbi:MAG: hypothetical protein ABR953_14145 [Candidatus Acidiferrales bacterium]